METRRIVVDAQPPAKVAPSDSRIAFMKIGWFGALFVLATAPAAAQAPFTLGGVTAAPGTLAAGSLAIAPHSGDSGTTIPFTVIHGPTSGPVLALIAGTHGMEYVPIIALQRLRSQIDPASLTGTIIMVHVANMPSFLGRTI